MLLKSTFVLLLLLSCTTGQPSIVCHMSSKRWMYTQHTDMWIYSTLYHNISYIHQTTLPRVHHMLQNDIHICLTTTRHCFEIESSSNMLNSVALITRCLKYKVPRIRTILGTNNIWWPSSTDQLFVQFVSFQANVPTLFNVQLTGFQYVSAFLTFGNSDILGVMFPLITETQQYNFLCTSVCSLYVLQMNR